MLSEKLKEDTKIVHQEVERLLVQKIQSINAIDSYLDLLTCFYKFFAPLEQEIFLQSGDDLPDLANRRKMDWIKDDLQFFHSSHSIISSYPSIPPINSNFQALGALYVIEGSTLGGPMISKMISQKLGISTEKGFRFFSGYGKATGKMWEKFKNYINIQILSQDQENEVINAAILTFCSFKRSIC